MPAETIFTIRGINLEYFPNEVVMSFNSAAILSSETQNIASMVSNDGEEATFRVLESNTYSSEHTWNVFGTPNTLPRQIIDVDFI